MQKATHIMLIQQHLVSIRETDFARGEFAALGWRQVMESVFVQLCETSAEIAADEVFPSLELGLDHDEGEVGFGVHVAGHFFDFLDLTLYLFVYAVD